MSIGAGVLLHFFRQWTLRPIGLLRTFIQFDAEEFLDERAQAELALAQEPAGQHGIENRTRDKLVMFFEQAQIVIRAVHDEFVGVKGVEERVELDLGQGIHEAVLAGDADLDEANFFRIGMEAVRLGVERHPLGGAQFGQERC